MPTLAIHTGAIGDFLLACPALAEIAKRDRLELAGNPSRLSLAVEAGLAQAAHDLDRIGFHTIFDDPSQTLRAFLRRFDRVIVWLRDSGGAIGRGLADCGVVRADIFPGLPDAQWARHASEYYAECLGLRGLPPLELAIAPGGPPLDIVIHAGSGSVRKNWPLEYFVEVAQEFIARGRRLTWCLGPAEAECGLSTDLPGDFLRRESLVDLARCLAGARLFLGNDSGITHLAAALGVPAVAIFGPTDPAVWAPRGDHVRVLKGSPWPAVAELRQLLGGAVPRP